MKNIFIRRWLYILTIVILSYIGITLLLRNWVLASHPHPLLNMQAPDLTLSDINGKTYSLNELSKGKKAIVIDFWAPWCAPCRLALPSLNNLAKEYKLNEDVLFLAVNVFNDNINEISHFIKKANIENLQIYLETKENPASETFKFNGIPAIFVLSGDRTIKKFFSGYSKNVDKAIKQQIEALLKAN